MKVVPKFSSEAEEARWWAEHQDDFGEEAGQVLLDPAKSLGLPPKAEAIRKASEQIALRVPKPELARAKKLAEKRGLPYQTLLKMPIHEGLDRLEREADREFGRVRPFSPAGLASRDLATFTGERALS